MKNKFFIILFIVFFFLNANSEEEIIFKATEINILDEGNLIRAKKGSEVILPDNIIVISEEFEYNKLDSLLEFSKNILAEDKINDLKLKTEKLKYLKNKKILNTFGETTFLIQSDYKIDSKNVTYNKKKELLFSKEKSKITDTFNNQIKVDEFSYNILKNIIKTNQMEILDTDKNKYTFENAIIDLNNKKILGKDIVVKLDKSLFSSDNDPRFKGRSIKISENKTEITKGVFTICKIKKDKCPPWHMTAEKIEHNKKDKLINYKNAWLKLYDMPILYFPKFFHPDPTVKRQSGFLIPTISESSTTGSSLSIPYFKVISKSKDLTFKPRIFTDKIIIQNEYRQVKKNSYTEFDFSYFIENENNTGNSKNKNHFFAKSTFDLVNTFFDNSKLEINIQKLSNDTYLKAYNITSNLINSVSTLTSYVDFEGADERNSLSASFKVYENLSKKQSDRYEFVYPYIQYTRLLNENNNIMNISYDVSSYQKKYDTDVYEGSLINNLNFNSNPLISLKGLKNIFNLQLKNVNKDSKNNSSIKRTTAIYSKLMYESSLPLIKYGKNGNSTLTPKFSLMYSPDKSKNIINLDRNINFDNVFGFNRLGVNDSVEGGTSLTYGIEYAKLNQNKENIFSLGLANVQREKKDPDLPLRSTLGNQTSDIFGTLKYNTSKWLELEYNFAIDNNIDKSNFDEIKSTFSINNFVTSFSFLDDAHSANNQSYLSNTTKYKFDENRSVSFAGRRNRELDMTEFYNLIYEYKNDCLKAGVEYKKDFYSDSDIEPNESLFFTLTIVPFGKTNSPSIGK